MKYCDNYSRNITDKMLGNQNHYPMACHKIREILSDIASMTDCSCCFKRRAGQYPHPLRHLESGQVFDVRSLQAGKNIPRKTYKNTIPDANPPISQLAEVQAPNIAEKNIPQNMPKDKDSVIPEEQASAIGRQAVPSERLSNEINPTSNENNNVFTLRLNLGKWKFNLNFGN